MTAFFGTFINKIDAKGRVSVPAPYRAFIQARGLTSVAVHPSLFEPCLEGAGLDRFTNLALAAEDSFVPETLTPTPKEEAAELIMETLRELSMDSEGRIVLPDDFMAKASLKEQAAFVGRGKKFLIWDPATLEKRRQAKLDRVIASVKSKGGEQP